MSPGMSSIEEKKMDEYVPRVKYERLKKEIKKLRRKEDRSSD